MVNAKFRGAAAIALAATALATTASDARAQVALGINWQSNFFDFGPYVVQDFGASAFGVPGENWYNSLASSSFYDGASIGGVVPFVPLGLNGAIVNVAWSAENYNNGRPYTAYGFAHANEPGGGVPLSAEEAVLAAFLFADYHEETDVGNPIKVIISGLSEVATFNGVPLQYSVKVIASSEWDAVSYTPALLTDSNANSELVSFSSIWPDHPQWNGGGSPDLMSSGATGDSTMLFTGDTLTITIDGPNGYADGDFFGRSTLAGIAIYFGGSSATSIPEPSTMSLVGIAAVLGGGWLARRRAVLKRVAAVAALCVAALLPATSQAGPSFGINWQNDFFGFGPWNVADYGPSAFGVPSEDWFNSLASSQTTFAPFTSPGLNGGIVNLAWSSENYYGTPYAAYGWSHANEVGGGVPLTAEEAVLAAFMFASYDANLDIGSKIKVTISGLDDVATVNGVPLRYKVKVIASSDWGLPDHYTPAMVTDNAANSESVDFTVLPNNPRWNEAYFSTGAVGESEMVFTGDTLHIELAGPNEEGTWGEPGYGRTALAGLAIIFEDSPIGPMPDLNMDGKVDIFDVAIVSNNWANSGTPGTVTGDANKDGVVDIFDVALISNNWNPGSATSVPEPTSAALLLAGLAAVVVAWKRRGVRVR